MDVLTIALAVLVGLALGTLGGGGSILTVPLLVYVAGQEASAAIATSLLVVGVTSAVGAVGHARRGNVRWRTAGIFGAAGMVGAYGGGRVGALLPGPVLLVAFSVLLVVTAAVMLRGRRDVAPTEHGAPATHVLVHGVVVGAVTGLVGAGGGFLVVPALVVLGGLPMHAAVGTSLVVIAMKSGAGLAGYLSAATIDVPLAVGVTVAAAAGALLGGALADRVPADRLRTAFGWFVLLIGALVLAAELPGALRLVAVLPVVLVAADRWRARRRSDDPPHDPSDHPTVPLQETLR